MQDGFIFLLACLFVLFLNLGHWLGGVVTEYLFWIFEFIYCHFPQVSVLPMRLILRVLSLGFSKSYYISHFLLFSLILICFHLPFFLLRVSRRQKEKEGPYSKATIKVKNKFKQLRTLYANLTLHLTNRMGREA